MIPLFDSGGILPPGIHLASLEEFEGRFVYTIWRRQLFNCLLKLIEDLKNIGCRTLYIDGSFITNKRLPSDMDICWEDLGIDYAYVERVMPILFDLDYPRVNQHDLYKADIFPAHFLETGSGLYFINFFQKDKITGAVKGIIKIKIK